MSTIADACRDGFAAAAAALGVRERHYELMGRVVRVRYAGAELERLLHPAMAHRETAADGAVGLTLHAYDSASGAPAIAPPSGVDAETRDAFYLDEGAVRALWRSDTCAVLDGATAEGWLWVAAPAAVDLGIASAPFRPIVEWWARPFGLERAHAGAVGTSKGGVLIGGVGGSGKSTTSLACLRAGLGYAGDDAVLVSAPPDPVVWSLYNTAKLEADHVTRLPWLAPAVANPDRLHVEKAVAYAYEIYPERCVAGFPLRAFLWPRVTGRATSTLVPLPAPKALAALAPSSLVLQAGDHSRTFAVLASVVRSVPCYVLESGTDLDGLARLVAELIDQLSEDAQ